MTSNLIVVWRSFQYLESSFLLIFLLLAGNFELNLQYLFIKSTILIIKKSFLEKTQKTTINQWFFGYPTKVLLISATFSNIKNGQQQQLLTILYGSFCPYYLNINESSVWLTLCLHSLGAHYHYFIIIFAWCNLFHLLSSASWSSRRPLLHICPAIMIMTNRRAVSSPVLNISSFPFDINATAASSSA